MSPFKKNLSLNSRLKIYSVEELSKIIVNLEKNQANLREKLAYSKPKDLSGLKSEFSVNEVKLDEYKTIQQKVIRAKK